MINNEIKKVTTSYFPFYFVSRFNYSISFDESLKIIGLKRDNLTKANLIEKYNYLISKNNPYKSGSFYIQSKIHNAKEKLIPLCKKTNNINTMANKFKIKDKDNIYYQYKKSKVKNKL